MEKAGISKEEDWEDCIVICGSKNLIGKLHPWEIFILQKSNKRGILIYTISLFRIIKMSTININIPDQFFIILNENAEELSGQMKLYTALLLFKTHKLTLKQAANFADLTLMRFIDELGKHEIPVIDYNPEELQEELESFK